MNSPVKAPIQHLMPGLDPDLASRLEEIRADLIDEYKQPHDHPWVIGYSGGKDSTLVVQLAFDLLLDIPKSERRREIHIVANDTLVDGPIHLGGATDDPRSVESNRGRNGRKADL